MVNVRSYLLAISSSTRLFIFTALAILTPFYLLSFKMPLYLIGVLISVTTLTSIVFLYVFYFIKKTRIKLYLASSLLFASLLLIALFKNPVIFVIALLMGGISLSGKDMTPNKAVEQYAISHYEVIQKSKNEAYSIYNFSAYAAGTLASISLVFINLNLVLYMLILLSAVQFFTYWTIHVPDIERKSEGILKAIKNLPKDAIKLSALFAMDSFGGGLITLPLIILWFKYVYNISLTTAGIIFTVVNIITAISILLSAKIANRMGVVNTMVITHLISNVMLILIPVYHLLLWGELFLFLRQTTSQMDVPARDSFINTIIPKEERVKTNTIFLSSRNMSQLPGPLIGAMLIELFPPLLFIVTGIVKSSYDISFYLNYKNYKI
ncbi:MAG: MFS transporter [Candidatus Thermoplasmatota archaeon]|jgi:hypothetical protein|nr:MFS transporter [Candidatus Thermoplasmatota archaeon]MCL5963503.1 MFS transporter [Candidatus Thermoplasmatota archaeon]